jgi:hypothetical protein
MALLQAAQTQTHSGTKTWTRFCLLFQKEFATASDDKLIIEGLVSTSCLLTENARDYFSCLSDFIEVVTDSYASYQNKLDRPAEQAQGRFSKKVFTKYGNENVENFTNYIFLQLFRAGLHKNNCHLLFQKDQDHGQ